MLEKATSSTSLRDARVIVDIVAEEVAEYYGISKGKAKKLVGMLVIEEVDTSDCMPVYVQVKDLIEETDVKQQVSIFADYL